MSKILDIIYMTKHVHDDSESVRQADALSQFEIGPAMVAAGTAAYWSNHPDDIGTEEVVKRIFDAMINQRPQRLRAPRRETA